MENRRTPLYDFHRQHGGRMVPFAGWDMPVQYQSGIKAEHLATRSVCGLFDVSHMAQIELRGADADALLEQLTPTDLGAIAEGRVRYSLFLNEMGGVLDDLMIARLDGTLHLVCNAGRATHDINHIRSHIEARVAENPDADVEMTVHDTRALLALQGPKAASVLTELGANLDEFIFMDIRHISIADIACQVTRSGYTGEDGFEISLAASNAENLAERLAAHKDVTLAGLGARDTLRMEAGLPLWGHELHEGITPVMGGVRFALSKRRREAGDFPGAQHIMRDFNQGPARQLVGLLPAGGRPIRDGTILLHNGTEIGYVSSGGFAPSLDAPAALGFVTSAFTTDGTIIMAATRGKETPVRVSSLPLVPHRYVRSTPTPKF